MNSASGRQPAETGGYNLNAGVRSLRNSPSGNHETKGVPSAFRRIRTFGVLLLPAALAFLVQAPSLSHGFMADDFLIILGNPQITESSSVSDLLWTDWFDRGGTGSIGYYRPVTKASFRLTFALAGPSPFAFHLGNLVLHAIGVLLLTLLLLQLFERPFALLGATLWGLHPMTVQAVQNVTARSDLLAGAFFLGALVLVARWTRTERWPWLFASVVLAVLAMGSKESALLLPFAAGAVVTVLGGTLRRSLLAFSATSLSVVAALLVRLSVLELVPHSNPLASLSVSLKLASVFKAVGSYAISLLSGRPIVRLPQVPEGFSDPGVLFGVVLVLLLAGIVVSTRLRSPAALGIVILGASLAPALAIWHIRIPMWKAEIPIAERWLYLPAAGAALLAAAALRRLPSRYGVAAGASLAAAFGLATTQMTPAYASAEAYRNWAADHVLSSPPRNPREEHLSHLTRARRFRDELRNDEALQELLAADRIAPWLPEHRWQLADVLLALGRPKEAVAVLEQLLSPEFRFDPAGIAQRIEMGNDSLERLHAEDTWRFLARAREAAGDEAGARDARSTADRIARSQPTAARPGGP